MTKPRIINGICEFCGVSADTCPHYSGQIAIEDNKQDNIVQESPSRKETDRLHYGSRCQRHCVKIADIIIPHHDQHKLLADCLDKLPNDIFNIIVVSGGSFAENCNRGAKMAVTDNIIILNDDVIPNVDVLLEACDNHSDIVGFYQIVPDDNDKNKIRMGIAYKLVHGRISMSIATSENDISLPSGFALRVKKDAWQKLKGFDVRFINGAEDHDFGLRAIKSGMTIDYIRKPMIHKHSQSSGRLEHVVKNRKLLDDLWSNDEVIELLNLDRPRYNILIANNHLSNLGGTETWTYTMAKEIERKGHYVDVFTNEKGFVSNMLNCKDLNELRSEYDLLIINHNTCLQQLQHIKGIKVFTSHGIYPKLEQVAEGADIYLGISEEIIGYNKYYGWDLGLINNPVDLNRFKPIKPLNKKPKKVLSLCKTEEANEVIREACKYLGIEAVACRERFDIENEINEADIVITLGRGAYEAMSCGRNVIVFDYRPYVKKYYGDGYVNDNNRQEILKNNYSGRYTNKEMTVEYLINEIGKYNKDDGAKNREFAENNFDASDIADKYISFLKTIKKEKIKFKFIDSSTTDYGIAKHLEREMIMSNEFELSDDGVSICYANDLGDITPDTGEPRTIHNSFTLKRAVYSNADFLFYSQLNCKKFFENRDAYYLPSAINHRVFCDLNLTRDIKIGFVGKNDWPARNEFLKRMSSMFNNDFVRAEGIFLGEVAEFYNRCQIVVNHSVVNEINMRMFEATACGALLITQHVDGIEKLWSVGREIITYKTYDEAIDLISYYKNNPAKARKIAEAGQWRTLRDHKYSDRVNKIKEIICEQS